MTQRDEILDCACQLYLDEGPDGLKMRRLAEAVGVTPGALYRHYEGKDGVLLDLVGRAHETLLRHLTRALQGGSPAERMRLAEAAYLDFALEEARLYKVYYATPELIGIDELPEETADRARAIRQFWKDRVTECVDAGLLRDRPAEELGLTLWSHAHGLLSLYHRGLLPALSVSRRRPFTVEESRYPFEDGWLERGGAAMHYVDDGEGRPVLLLHGNPTWSFLYREVIHELREECRCVAPDYPGFGFSDHPPGFGYTPEEHAEWVGELVDRLGLDGLVVVGQDWGGPIGLRVAVDRPGRTAGLVLANTWCWAPDWRMRLFSRLMGGETLGRWLQIRRNFFARRIVPWGIHRAERRTDGVLEAYRKPFPDPESRRGTWAFPRAIRTSAGWVEAIWRELDRLDAVPVELAWGRRDPALGRESHLQRWRERFPAAGVDRIGDAGHYVQEDRPDRVSAAVRRCLARAAAD